MDAIPSAQCAPIGSATSRSAVMVSIRGPVGDGRTWFWMDRSRRPDFHDEPHAQRDGRRSTEQRAVAPDLAGEDVATLRPEVALDEQHDRPVGDGNPGDRVGSNIAAEQFAGRRIPLLLAELGKQRRVAPAHLSAERR
jgi:hypothetical protein